MKNALILTAIAAVSALAGAGWTQHQAPSAPVFKPAAFVATDTAGAAPIVSLPAPAAQYRAQVMPVQYRTNRVYRNSQPYYGSQQPSYGSQTYGYGNNGYSQYPYDRPGTHRAVIIGGSAAAGAAIGGLAGHGKGAAIGAILGGAGGYLYDRQTRHDPSTRY